MHEPFREGGNLAQFHIAGAIARAADILQRDRDAAEVLRTFDLDILLDATNFIELAFTPVTSGHFNEPLAQISARFAYMTRSQPYWKLLATPAPLAKAEADHELLSIEIRTTEETPLSSIGSITKHVQDLYSSVAKLRGCSDSQLLVLKLESGSNIRIDCKGVAETVAEVRKLLLDLWRRIRFRKHSEVLATNEVLLSTLGVAEQLEEAKNSGALSAEEASMLKHKLLGSLSGIVESGALLTEIPREEIVDNTKLMAEFTPKRLPAPETPAEETTKPKKKRTSKRKKAKKQDG